MIVVCRATERSKVRRRERETWSTFGPGHQEGPRLATFGALETLDETLFEPGAGVAARPPPQDTENLTFLLLGALAQEDSTGRSGVLRAGEFQRLTTGRLVRHSERNASQTGRAHAIRMSFHPAQADRAYDREQKFFSMADRRGALRVVASPDGRGGSLVVHQDAVIYSAILDEGLHVVHALAADMTAWVHVVSGEIILDGLVLSAGDGVGVSDEPMVALTAREATEILLIDLDAPERASTNRGTG